MSTGGILRNDRSTIGVDRNKWLGSSEDEGFPLAGSDYRAFVMTAHACHVWLWRQPSTPQAGLDLSTLSQEEIGIARLFIFNRQIEVCDLSSYDAALAGGIKMCSRGIAIGTTAFGKLVLIYPSSELHFSLSHTSSHAMVAVVHTPVGVDVEQVRPIEQAVAEMQFSNNEQGQLAAYQREGWRRGFFRLLDTQGGVVDG
ncbi:MAG: hypothetical protein ABI197_11855 [Granulicella sp.]